MNGADAPGMHSLSPLITPFGKHGSWQAWFHRYHRSLNADYWRVRATIAKLTRETVAVVEAPEAVVVFCVTVPALGAAVTVTLRSEAFFLAAVEPGASTLACSMNLAAKPVFASVFFRKVSSPVAAAPASASFAAGALT